MIVIGGGSGGLATARRAASVYKKRVLLVEKSALGGTCVNYGCIPKKMLYNASLLYHERRWIGKDALFNWEHFREKREEYIKMLNAMYERRNESDGISVIFGEGVLEGKVVRVLEKEYTAEHVLIVTGSSPVVPKWPGASYCIDSDEFFRMRYVPKRVAVIGGGYIAVETAFILAAFGSEVTLLVRSGVLRKFDALVRESVRCSLVEGGVDVQEHAEISRIEDRDGVYSVCYTRDGKSEEKIVEKVIAAIGRGGNSGLIRDAGGQKGGGNIALDTAGPKEEGGERCGIEIDSEGFIRTDKTFQTGREGVYAIGDITMKEHMLTPVAIFAGRRLADFLYGTGHSDIKKIIKYVPTVIFSHPPSGSVGYSEEEAEGAGEEIKTHEIEAVHPYSFGSRIRNRYKIVYGAETDAVYGIHMNGCEVDEILQGFASLARNGVKFSQILKYFSETETTWEDLILGEGR